MKNEIEEISKKLRMSYMFELRKPEIDKFERVLIIRKILDEHNWTQQDLVREIGVGKSTIRDWLLYSKISEEKYQELISKGLTPTEIYRQLQAPNKYNLDKTIIENYKAIDYKINKFEQDIKEANEKMSYSEYTLELINELQKELENFKKDIKNEQIRKAKIGRN